MASLSDRMMTNVSFIKKGSTVADIGCDHGYVAIYLCKEGIAKRVIAMDIGEGPLSRARSHVEEAGVTDCVECRLSDGLSQLRILQDGTLEVDTVLIAGLGGRLAIRMMLDDLDKCRLCKSIVLQIQSDLAWTRESLVNNGFRIVDEAMVLEDGKFYTTMLVENGQSEVLTREDICFGPILLKKKDSVLHKWLNKEYAKFEEYIGRTSGTSREALEDKLKELSRGLEYYD